MVVLTAFCIATLMANLMLYAAAHVDILKYSLKNLDKNSKSADTSLISKINATGINANNILYVRCIACVQHHNALIE